MKALIFLFGLLMTCLPSDGKAQSPGKLYYLLDTAATPVNDRLWMVDIDPPYKSFKLQCKCIDQKDDPILTYSEKLAPEIFTKADLNKLHIIKLPELIRLLQNYFYNVDRSFDIYLIEPEGTKFKIHKTRVDRTRTVE